jgi:outer membrane protein assembly factor BamB
VVVASTDGNLYAYDTGNEGRLVNGFPLAVGSSVLTTPLLQESKLYAVSEEGSLKAWQLDNVGDLWWGQLYGNAQHKSFASLTIFEPPAEVSSGLIVDAETYNWPNPIRDGETFLRCMTSEDARVEITILDAAGTLVQEMTMEMRGGTPAEEVWQTDAESGVYFARVTATSTSGETATKLIKMAIIR